MNNFDKTFFLHVVGLMAIWNWRYHCAAVGKRSLMYFGMFGLATYLCDTIFLDRFDRAKAVQQMNAVVDQIQSKKVSAWIPISAVLCIYKTGPPDFESERIIYILVK